MIQEHIQTALELAHYEIIENEEPFYGEIAALQKAFGPKGGRYKNAAAI
jgi:hypothetical protein